MGGAQLMKRIPRIKFPQRRPKPADLVSQHPAKSVETDAHKAFFSRSSSSNTSGGKASLQPKRTPLSQEEIESILLGGCI